MLSEKVDAPAVAGEVGELPCERKRLNLGRKRHLEEAVGETEHDKVHQVLARRVDVVEVFRRVLGVDVFARDVEVRLAHLGQRPCRRVDKRLKVPRQRAGDAPSDRGLRSAPWNRRS